MAQNISNNFSEVFPKHPHRRVRILIAVLCFVVVVSMVTLYQINKIPKAPPISPEIAALNKQLSLIDSSNQGKPATEDTHRLLKLIGSQSGVNISATTSIKTK